MTGYGLLIPLALIGAESFLRKRKPQDVLILSWIACASILLYTPIFFQRRFSEGLHIPIAILAASGAMILINFLLRTINIGFKDIFKNILFVFFVLILSISSFERVLNDIKVIGGDNTANYYYHLKMEEVKGMLWVKDHTAQKDIILSNWFYGNLIPGFTGRKIYVGHKVQSPFFDQKIALVNKFLVDENPKTALDFLKSSGITYIFLGINDTMLQYGFKPDEKPYLTKIYNKGDVLIYKVK